MRNLFGVFLLVAVSMIAQAQDTKPVVVLDPALDDIVPHDAKIEKLAGGFGHAESPMWVRKGGYLLFPDYKYNRINKWSRDGKVSPFLEGADPGFAADGVSKLGGTNGLGMDRQGRIAYGTRIGHSVIRLEKDGRRTVLVSQYQGKNLIGINDLVYKSDGSLYFTDVTWGKVERIEKGIPEPKWELPMGIYLLKDGKPTLLDTDIEYPNGLAFTPDEKYIYLANYSRKKIMKYEVRADDTIANGQVFIDMSSEKEPSPPDGLKVDQKGNLYCACPGGVWIISPGGKHLGTIVFPERPSNFAFGDADGKTLYATAQTGLYRIRLKIPGIRP
jgi:gluconolactonase